MHTINLMPDAGGNPLALRWLAVAMTMACLLTPAAMAQEPIFTDAAVQPGAGRMMLREQFKYLSFSNDPSGNLDHADEFSATTILNLGVTGNFALSFRAPYVYRDIEIESAAGGGSETQAGIADMVVLGKLRVFKRDTSPIDTVRVALHFGAELPGGDDDYSSHSIDPIAGLAYTAIRGRHGINLSCMYRLDTSEDDDHSDIRGVRMDSLSASDEISADAAYLFRLAPESYTADTHGAWYLVLEGNGLYETSGDAELLLSPGLMYEARVWTLELAVQLPVYQHLDDRAEMDFAVLVGLRFLF